MPILRHMWGGESTSNLTNSDQIETKWSVM
jgi:hypothetical protein